MIKKLIRFMLGLFLMASVVAIPFLTLSTFNSLDDLYNRLRQLRDAIYDSQNTSSPYTIVIGHWRAIDQSSDLYINSDRIILVNNSTCESTPLKYSIIKANLKIFTLYIKIFNYDGVSVQTELITFSADLKTLTRTILNADPHISDVYTKSYIYKDGNQSP